MAQVAQAQRQSITESNHQALCPFYGSSHGCPYLQKCTMSHTDPNSIELCPAYQTIEGCANPTACYYRHCLPKLSSAEINTLQRKHKIAGKVQYSLSIKGKSVHRVHILINQVIWYAVHFIIEDDRLQHIHHQKYSSIYRYDDAILVSEFIANVLNRSPTPGKYLSYLKNLIDGDIEPGKEEEEQESYQKSPDSKSNKPLVHYRDILSSIGQQFDEIPRPVNPHLVKNLTRVPWTDFKLMTLPLEAYDYPDVYLKAGDLVRVWRPKKFVYHCGIYLGDKRIIHISNGMDDGVGGKWGGITGLFQSGSGPSAVPSVPSASSAASNGKYYDYGQKLKMQKMQESQLQQALGPVDGDENENDIDGDGGFEAIHKSEIEEYGDDDDMDLVGDSDDEENEDEDGNDSRDEQKMSELVMTQRLSGEEKPQQIKHSDLLYQDMSEENIHREMSALECEQARRARECPWTEFVAGSRKKDLELGYFVFPWRKPSEITYTAKFLTEIHYMKGQYSVFKNNCEHFALYCCTGLRYSPQANAIEKITTPMIGVASKITSFAGSILSKVVSLRNSPKLGAGDEAKENENRKNHPVLQEVKLDDGGDDELEKMLLDDSSKTILVMSEPKQNGKRHSPKLFGRRDRKRNKSVELESAVIEHGAENGLKFKKECSVVDEYANDEEDVLAESIILESNLEAEAVMTDMTPGGLSVSEVMVAQKHHQQQKWNI